MIHVVTGQTATGKTKRAIELAKKIDGEIISVDARQIYKYLDIVTGKDINKNSKFYSIYKIGKFDIGYYIVDDVKIWLYDLITPKEICTSYEFAQISKKLIKEIEQDEKMPILVGGSMFYLRSILFDSLNNKVEPDLILRDNLSKLSTASLQNILKNLDSALFKSLNNSDKNNPHRLIRKIEILKSGNKIKKSENKKSFEFKIEKYYHENSEILKEKITNRVLKRLEEGAVEEVSNLLKNGFTKNDPGFNTIGYIQLIKFLKNEINLEDAKTEWISKEMQYAKRQLTFMNKYF